MNALLLFILSVTLLCAPLPDQRSGDKCSLSFEVLNAGFSTHGTIQGEVVANTFDPSSLAESLVVVVAFPSTINTGIALRDKHLQREDYFNTSRYPEIRLTSQSFKKMSRTKFSSRFRIVIKNIEKEVYVPFTFSEGKDKFTFDGSFKINRREFDLGDASLTLADEVIVRFTIEKQPLRGH